MQNNRKDTQKKHYERQKQKKAFGENLFSFAACSLVGMRIICLLIDKTYLGLEAKALLCAR